MSSDQLRSDRKSSVLRVTECSPSDNGRPLSHKEKRKAHSSNRVEKKQRRGSATLDKHDVAETSQSSSRGHARSAGPSRVLDSGAEATSETALVASGGDNGLLVQMSDHTSAEQTASQAVGNTTTSVATGDASGAAPAPRSLEGGTEAIREPPHHHRRWRCSSLLVRMGGRDNTEQTASSAVINTNAHVATDDETGLAPNPQAREGGDPAADKPTMIDSGAEATSETALVASGGDNGLLVQMSDHTSAEQTASQAVGNTTTSVATGDASGAAPAPRSTPAWIWKTSAQMMSDEKAWRNQEFVRRTAALAALEIKYPAGSTQCSTTSAPDATVSSAEPTMTGPVLAALRDLGLIEAPVHRGSGDDAGSSSKQPTPAAQTQPFSGNGEVVNLNIKGVGNDRRLEWSLPEWYEGHRTMSIRVNGQYDSSTLPSLRDLADIGFEVQMQERNSARTTHHNDPAVNLAARFFVASGIIPALTAVGDTRQERLAAFRREYQRSTEPIIGTMDDGTPQLRFGSHSWTFRRSDEHTAPLLVRMLLDLKADPTHQGSGSDQLWKEAMRRIFPYEVRRAIADVSYNRSFSDLLKKRKVVETDRCKAPGKIPGCSVNGHFCSQTGHTQPVPCSNMVGKACRDHTLADAGRKCGKLALEGFKGHRNQDTIHNDRVISWAAPPMTSEQLDTCKLPTGFPVPSQTLVRMPSREEPELCHQVNEFVMCRGAAPPGFEIHESHLAEPDDRLLCAVRIPGLSPAIDRRNILMGRAPSLDRILPIEEQEDGSIGRHVEGNVAWTSGRLNLAKGRNVSPRAADLLTIAIFAHNIMRIALDTNEPSDQLLRAIQDQLQHPDEHSDCQFVGSVSHKSRKGEPRPDNDTLAYLRWRKPHLRRDIKNYNQASLMELVIRRAAVDEPVTSVREPVSSLPESGQPNEATDGACTDKASSDISDATSDSWSPSDDNLDSGNDASNNGCSSAITASRAPAASGLQTRPLSVCPIHGHNKKVTTPPRPPKKNEHLKTAEAFLTKDVKSKVKKVARAVIEKIGEDGVEYSHLFDAEGLPKLYKVEGGWKGQVQFARALAIRADEECDDVRGLPPPPKDLAQQPKELPLRHHQEFGKASNSPVTLLLTHLIFDVLGLLRTCHVTGLLTVGKDEAGPSHPLMRSYCAHRVHGLPMSFGWRKPVPDDLDDFSMDVCNIIPEAAYVNMYRAAGRCLEPTLEQVLEFSLERLRHGQLGFSVEGAVLDAVEDYYRTHPTSFVSPDAERLNQNMLYDNEQQRFSELSGIYGSTEKMIKGRTRSKGGKSGRGAEGMAGSGRGRGRGRGRGDGGRGRGDGGRGRGL